MLHDLLGGWRDPEDNLAGVQLWSVGWAGQGAFAGNYAGGADVPCFADPTSAQEGSVFALYGAQVDDLFVIDRAGQVRYRLHLPDFDLTDGDHRKRLDGWVRDLAAP